MKAASLIECYERLRDEVLCRTLGESRRWGENLLLTRGLAAWMDAWSDEFSSTSETRRTPVPVTSPRITETRLPGLLQQQLTSVLVEMILERSCVSA
jgi:hypothetical protein